MITIESITNHLFETEPEFVSNVAKDLNISVDDVQVDTSSGVVTVQDQKFTVKAENV